MSRQIAARRNLHDGSREEGEGEKAVYPWLVTKGYRTLSTLGGNSSSTPDITLDADALLRFSESPYSPRQSGLWGALKRRNLEQMGRHFATSLLATHGYRVDAAFDRASPANFRVDACRAAFAFVTALNDLSSFSTQTNDNSSSNKSTNNTDSANTNYASARALLAHVCAPSLAARFVSATAALTKRNLRVRISFPNTPTTPNQPPNPKHVDLPLTNNSAALLASDPRFVNPPNLNPDFSSWHWVFGPLPNSSPNSNTNDYVYQHWLDYYSLLIPREKASLLDYESLQKTRQAAIDDGIFVRIYLHFNVPVEFALLDATTGVPLLRDLRRDGFYLQLSSPHFSPFDDLLEPFAPHDGVSMGYGIGWNDGIDQIIDRVEDEAERRIREACEAREKIEKAELVVGKEERAVGEAERVVTEVSKTNNLNEESILSLASKISATTTPSATTPQEIFLQKKQLVDALSTNFLNVSSITVPSTTPKTTITATTVTLTDQQQQLLLKQPIRKNVPMNATQLEALTLENSNKSDIGDIGKLFTPRKRQEEWRLKWDWRVCDVDYLLFKPIGHSIMVNVAPTTATNGKDRYDPITITTVPKPTPVASQVLVKICAAALNHRDVYIREGQYPGIEYGSILGSDASGVIADANGSLKWAVGDTVLINPAKGWISQPSAPEDIFGFKILGLAEDHGTFAEFISVHEDDVVRMPNHLTVAQGAALPLAGLTAYRALVSLGQCKRGDVVLIPGIGGGVALFALQFAVASGATVYVTSSSPSKIAKAVSLGAAGGVLYTSPTWPTELESMVREQEQSSITLVIDGAAGNNVKSYVRVCAPGARICIYGAVSGSSGTLTFPYLWFKHLTIHGVCMGSRREFEEMVQFVGDKKVVPVVDFVLGTGLSRLEGVEEAFTVMREGKQMGKIVVAGIGEENVTVSNL
ncbi:hypothetical protein HK100_000243 [Physocladia obscura]|uniref:Enoyl reductase (ER) domain-containing protein n=1 Tax=Physocladia obscura TaxID=109957 RepID=A0AAD5T184_9FUNG|nr:hypothetical protein HK100_000243 [Physocladia obscura]